MSSERTKKIISDAARQVEPSKSRVEAIRQRNRKRKKIRRIIFLILFLGLVTGAVFFFRSPRFLIKDVVVEGAHVLDENELRAVAERELKGYYLWVIPKRSMFFFPKHDIEKALRTEFKRIETLSLFENGRLLRMALTERESVYLWCGEEARRNPEPCYFIDETGYVFSKAPFFSGSIYFKFFGPLESEGTDGPLGGRVLPEAVMSGIIVLKENMENTALVPYAFMRGSDGEAAFLLSESYESERQTVRFILKDDTQIIFRNLKAAISAAPLKDDINKKFDTLLYLDLRYPEKVYYKFEESGE